MCDKSSTVNVSFECGSEVFSMDLQLDLILFRCCFCCCCHNTLYNSHELYKTKRNSLSSLHTTIHSSQPFLFCFVSILVSLFVFDFMLRHQKYNNHGSYNYYHNIVCLLHSNAGPLMCQHRNVLTYTQLLLLRMHFFFFLLQKVKVSSGNAVEIYCPRADGN